MTEDAKGAKQRRLAEALRANLRRRKSAAKGAGIEGAAIKGAAMDETRRVASNEGAGGREAPEGSSMDRGNRG